MTARIAVRESEAARLLDIGESTLRRLRARGVIPPPRMIGGSARYLVKELEAAMEAMPVSGLPPPPRARQPD